MKYPKIIFIHIAKTGGTSLVGFFNKRLASREVMSHGDFNFDIDPPLAPEVVAPKKFISGHFGFDHVEAYLEGAYSFTLLRDPLARVMSFYRFCMHEDMQRRFAVAQAARDLSINDFMCSKIPAVCEALDNLQTWQIASMYRYADRSQGRFDSSQALLDQAKGNLAKLSHVGFTENYDASFTRVISDVGLPVPPRIPNALRTPQPISPESLDPDVLLQLKDRLKLDYALYDHAKSLYWAENSTPQNS